jgi:chemotaxis protein CheD
MTAQMVQTQDETTVVGLGELKVSKDRTSALACLGLGSCVCVACYDPVSKVGGMAHVVLPDSGGRASSPDPKYADMAIPMLLEEMRECGALKIRTVIKLAGGAELSTAPGLDNAFKIGEKNQEAVKVALSKEGVKVKSEELGGNKGRTVRMYVDTGRVVVTTAGSDSREL